MITHDVALNNLAILSEILVDVSKSHIMPKRAIEDIRKLGISSIYEVMSKQIKLLGLYRNLSMETDVFERSKYWERINKIELEDDEE